MKRQLNAEQQAKRDERKAKLRALASRVAKMSGQERAELASRCPVMTIEGRYLSGNNQCMMALQMPGATVVGGFRQWIKAGRAVMKGQHGAAIWVPIGRKATDKETGESETVEKSAFILGTVFDVSQTQEIETGATRSGEAYNEEEASQAREMERDETPAAAMVPHLLHGEKQGDLISSTQAEPLALVSEEALDGAKVIEAREFTQTAHAATLAQNLELELV